MCDEYTWFENFSGVGLMLVRALPAVLIAPSPDFAPKPSKTMDFASDSNSSNGTHFSVFGGGLWYSKQTYTSLGSILMWDCICIEPSCAHSCVRLAAAAEIDRFWARAGWPKHWSQAPRSGPRQALHQAGPREPWLRGTGSTQILS